MGGRGGSSGLTAKNTPRQAAPQPQPQPQVQAQQQPQPQPQLQQQPQQAQGQVDAQGFSDTDNQGFHQLKGGRQYYQQQSFDIDTRTALTDYLDPNTQRGSLYNASQNMNYALTHGTMNAQQQFMYDTLSGAMHNLGQNITLSRYDHGAALDDMLKTVAGYTGGHQNVSISTLKNMLVGGTFTDQRILSTSYNDFAKASDPSTFTTREVKITYRAKASAQGLMPGISSIGLNGAKKGDDFGEMLLGPSGNGHNTYKVVDVKYSGANARPKGGSKGYLPLKQIEIVVEVD